MPPDRVPEGWELFTQAAARLKRIDPYNTCLKRY